MKITKEFLKRIIKEELGGMEEMNVAPKYSEERSPEAQDAAFEAAKQALEAAKKSGNQTAIQLMQKVVEEYQNALADINYNKQYPR